MGELSGSANNLPLILVLDTPIPACGGEKDSFSELGEFSGLFDPRRTLLISPFTKTFLPAKKLRGPIRDELAAWLSHTVWIAEIRSKGVMEEIARNVITEGRRVTVFKPDKFDSYTAGNKKLLDDPHALAFYPPTEAKQKNESITARKSLLKTAPADLFEDHEYLFHFTRSCPGRWPGQSWKDYLSSLYNGDPGSSHGAPDTLTRIINEMKLRGASRLIRGDQPMVSFTACNLEEMRKLITWNRSLIRWSFQPYGLAIRKEALQKAGARPVIYANAAEYDSLGLEDMPFFQLHNPPRTDWTREREWRVQGDLDLRAFKIDEIVVVVPRESFPLLMDIPFRIAAASQICGRELFENVAV